MRHAMPGSPNRCHPITESPEQAPDLLTNPIPIDTACRKTSDHRVLLLALLWIIGRHCLGNASIR
mgnify:CR=1 FL=1